MRRAGVLTLLTMLVGTGLVATAGSASADPYDCSVSTYNKTWGRGTCTNGTGTFRVYTRCDKPWASDYTVYASHYTRVGETSWASCSDGNRAYSPGIQIGPN